MSGAGLVGRGCVAATLAYAWRRGWGVILCREQEMSTMRTEMYAAQRQLTEMFNSNPTESEALARANELLERSRLQHSNEVSQLKDKVCVASLWCVTGPRVRTDHGPAGATLEDPCRDDRTAHRAAAGTSDGHH